MRNFVLFFLVVAVLSVAVADFHRTTIPKAPVSFHLARRHRTS